MLQQHGPQRRLGNSGEAGGVRMPKGLPPGGAKVPHGGDRRTGRNRAREREAQPGHRRAAGVA